MASPARVFPQVRLGKGSTVSGRPLHAFARVTGYVLNASATNEFGADGLSELQLIATQLAFDRILGLTQSIFRVTSVGSSQLTTLCGGNDAGALSIGSGTAVQVDLTNCSNSNQTWTDTAEVGASVAQAVGTLDLASGAYLQLLSVTAGSLAMYASGLGSFNGNFEVDSDESGALSSTKVLVIRVSNASVLCPTTSCVVTDCPSGYSCSCSWDLVQGTSNTSNYYCISSYSQTDGSSDESDSSLYALLALLLIPLVCLCAFMLMKHKGNKAEACDEEDRRLPQPGAQSGFASQNDPIPVAGDEYPKLEPTLPLSYPPTPVDTPVYMSPMLESDEE